MTNKTSVLGDVHKKTVSFLKSKKDKENYSKYRNEFDLASNFKKIQKENKKPPSNRG